MSKKDDKLQKPNARLSQPPDSISPGPEAAYSPLTAKEKYSKSYTDSGHMQSEEQPAVPGGILKDQSRAHGPNYPGRPTPPVQQVTQATVQTGVAKKCSETQLDSANRSELNSRVRVEGQP